MNEHAPDVTLNTLHQDLTDLGEQMRALKVTMVTGFASMPTRESSEEIIRLLREGNRISGQRFTRLDVRAREQHLETQQALHALAESQRGLTDEQRALTGDVRGLNADVKELSIQNKALSGDIGRLIARIDAIIRRRDNGGPA